MASKWMLMMARVGVVDGAGGIWKLFKCIQSMFDRINPIQIGSTIVVKGSARVFVVGYKTTIDEGTTDLLLEFMPGWIFIIHKAPPD